MLEQTITQLRQLKLTGMADALLSQIEQPGTYEGLSFEPVSYTHLTLPTTVVV